MRKGVHLVTYVDRLAGTIAGVADLLRGPLHGFAGVHLLPFFVPFDGVDAGFDPEDHTSVDPRLGGWPDVADLAADVEVTADVIVNHLSAGAAEYRDWLARGARSPYDGMFLTLGRVFPGGATEEELAAIYRPRPGLPFTPTLLADGTRRLVWTTFDSRQVDIDVAHPEARRYLRRVLDVLAAAGVATVRLDAVGYAVKTRGTSCFLTPETLAFVDEMTAAAHDRGLEVLVEFHGHTAHQQALAGHADYVYDFALPPLVLHAVHGGGTDPLARWLDERPANAVTVLDTHDGIGIVDVAAEDAAPGLLSDTEITTLAAHVDIATGGVSGRASRHVPWRTFPYQLNTTYYDALGGDDGRYLAARLLQLFVPGVPQVYYIGLLAGGNDVALLDATGVGRDVNRHRYRRGEVAEALERPVVQALLAAIRLRGTHPAFGGICRWTVTGEVIEVSWRHGHDEVSLECDLHAGRYAVRTGGGAAAPELEWTDER